MQLETVVVTGELITRSAERTTTSVSVQTGKAISRSTARDVYDVIRSTANASVYDSDLGYGSVTLRGIGSYGAGPVQSIALYSAATAIVVDGVALPRSAMGYSDLSAFDLEQVEIFRGPQSTSQGRNAMAGAIIVNSAEPDVEDHFTADFRGRYGVGNDAAVQGAVGVGATLWPDLLAVRLVTDHRTTYGDLINVTRNQRDWAHDGSHGSRLRAKLTPFGADGPYSALLGVAGIRRITGSRYVEQDREAERVATSDVPSSIASASKLYSIDQRLQLGEVWNLRAVSAYIRSRTRMHIDTDYSAADDGFLDQIQDANAFSQELRASFEAGAWRGSFGGYYFKGHDGDRYSAETAASAFVEAFGLCGLQVVCGLPLGNIEISGAAPANIEDFALFGEVDWQLSSRLKLTAGLRLDHERNSRRSLSQIGGDTVIAETVVTVLQSSGVLGQDGEVSVGRSFSALLPKFAASYELFKGWYLGAAYTEGYRPGGDGYNYASGRIYSFDSERTRNYELSLKGHIAPWRTQLALNLFHTDWDDMQVLVGAPPDTFIDNAGRSRIDGGELELSFTPVQRLRLISAFGVTHGRFTDFQSAQGDYSGNPLPKAPNYSASLAAEWSPWTWLLIRPDVRWTGPTPAQPDDAPTHQIERYMLANLALRLGTRRFSLFVNGSNLGDRHFRTDAATYSVRGNQVAALGYGRRVFGGLEFQF